ncbi:MAG TPA: serine/threonine-protein phosphatase [Lachnospiraceae bacterium]|nr:serine/threonine-protein phosphatase [Eubacterium sp.]HBZ03969.1 serine/threonine-protein phosphatase [Lachnospiraceae bacterium]
MEFAATYNTDIGIRKSTNQDSVAIRIIDTPDGQVAFAIVCDGMGGLAKGELASKEVITAFCRWFDEEFVSQVVEGTFTALRLRDDWNSIIQTENRLLGIYGSDNNIMLGTTVSAILMYKGDFYIVHVGDSRVYELTDGIRILTKDQTFVAREVAAGRMTPEEAKVDPRRSVLLQCVGASAVVTPDFLKGKVQPGSIYFVCSDGFRHQISEEEIMEKLGPSSDRTLDELKYGCVYLTELDKNRKETDNITIAVIAVN